MRTEVALGSRVAIRVYIQGVIGTRLHTRFASYAAAVVEIDDPVIAPEQGTGGADLDAGRRVAVIAAHHAKMTAGLGKFALLYVFDPGPKDPDRNVVFLFAGNRASVTTDAAVVINDETVAHSISPSPAVIRTESKLSLPNSPKQHTYQQPRQHICGKSGEHEALLFQEKNKTKANAGKWHQRQHEQTERYYCDGVSSGCLS